MRSGMADHWVLVFDRGLACASSFASASRSFCTSLSASVAASFVDFECFAAVRADNFVHGGALHSYWSLPRCQSISLLGIAFVYSSRTGT